MKAYEFPNLGETLYREQLPNGLTVAVVPRPGFSRKLAYFLTDFGAMYTDFELEGEKVHTPAGVAHFLEHKMFDLPDGRDVTAELAALGASTNAFTSYDETAYYVGCTDHFQQCLRLLIEFVSTPYFTEESVQKEIGIIDQEIGMNLDAPDNCVFQNLISTMYQQHPVRVPILGTSESIRQITPEMLYKCHKAFYTPGNMILCVVGDVDPEEVKAIALEMLGDQPRPVGRKLRSWQEPETVSQPDPRGKMDVAMPTFQLGFKGIPAEPGEAGVREEVVGDLAAEALFGESSPLYLKLYEQGLIDSSFGGGFETLDDLAMLLCSGDSDDPEAVRAAILDYGRHLAREGVPQEDFLRMKRSVMGRRVCGLDGFDSTCYRVCGYKTTGVDYFRFPELYQDIRREEIQEFLTRYIREDRCALSVIDPLEEEET